ncbi:MAG: amino acid adenylation domain-containing protein, partial [Micromonosporaceae bacterium]|nr:amino acid adenylation domain-containing protein [Micromonosporaceae bacterium]
LSFAQERVWFMDQVAPGSAAYLIAVPLRMRGPLDTDRLQAALDALTARHEQLRACFPADPDGRPTVLVPDRVEVPLRRVDAPDEAAAQALVDRAALEPFDLSRAPLLRALLIRLSTVDHILLLTEHHIIGDGWSVDVLLRDLVTLYRGGQLPELPVRYGDFAHWEADALAGPAARAHLDYWTARLAGTPALELPADRPRPAVQTYHGDFVEFTVERGVTDGLAALARSAGATTFMALLAAYQVLLARHSGQDDFAVGVSTAGRSAPELENVVGMFINMLPLRAEVSGGASFRDLLDCTRQAVLDGFEHAEVPFARVVQELGVPRDVRRSPVFQAMFVLQNYEMGRFVDAAGSAVEFRWTPMELPATRFDLELHAVELPGGLWGKVVYNTDLFDRGSVQRIAARWERLLRAIVAAPDDPISTLDILGTGERELVLAAGTGAAVPVPEATLHALVERQATGTPEATAVTYEGRSVSYAELNAMANRIAHRLRAAGVGPETLVAVCAQRCVEMVAGLLGVLKAGGGYLPLDPDYPADRLAFMLTDAGAPVVLAQSHLRDRLPATGATVLVLDEDATWAGQPDGNPVPLAGPDNLAYLIYTSGSTGRPKGVPNTHRAVANRLDWMQREYRLGAQDAVLQKTPTSFDVSGWEIFWPLQTGARLVLARPGGHRDAAYLRDLLVAERITTTHFVPSMLAVFLAEPGVEAAGTLRRLICSGEQLPVSTAQELLRRLPGCRLYNLYGPTEAAIDVSAWTCAPGDLAGRATVPIGAPIANLQLYILDSRLAPVPVGVAGELYIGGAGLARGYHRRPALTAERFLPCPFGPPGGRMYRTGDLARWRAEPDGGWAIEFLGRLDHQVKLRGLRIELGEIESVLRELPGVSDAAVVVREDSPGDPRLAGYLVGPAQRAEVRAALKEKLPDYMVPQALVTLEALPLTPSGKLDRAALPVPVATREPGAAATPPGTGTERMVAEIWSAVLGIATLGIDDDFFDLGGHSMLATQVVARIRKVSTGRPVGVTDLFIRRTIRDLAAFIDSTPDAGDRRPLLHELTRKVPSGQSTVSYVCVPYGGGSAVVYQPLADALPAGRSLYALAVPGHDIGLDEPALPFHELTARVADEVLDRISGPLVLYGHCGVGSAIIVEVARRLEAAGRELTAVYIGAMFPFARPRGPIAAIRARLEKLRSNRHYASWLKSMGVDIDEVEPEQADRIISNMRADSRAAEEYFTGLLDRGAGKLCAPVISVVGSEDPVTDYFTERYAEWQFLSDTVGLVVLDQAGHFFLRYRADELAEIVTTVHPAIAAGRPEPVEPAARGTDAPWTLRGYRHATA